MIGEHNYSHVNINKKLIKEKISSQELCIGMYVVELDRPWTETPFLFQGFLISSSEEIDQLRQYCQYVFIDVTQTTVDYAKTKTANQSQEVKNKRIYKVPVEQELAVAATHFDFAKNSINNALNSLRFSQEMNTKEIKKAVRNCVDSIVKNPNAMMWFTQIKNKDDYTAEHSLRVGIISIALGQELGLMEGELEDLGMAGMLHDVGKINIPIEVLNKEGSLNKEEYELIKTHAALGRQLLMSKSDAPPITVDVAYSHHEQMNGKGYPRGITADKIPYFAKIVGVVDAFDAITSDRVYSDARSTLEALRILYDCRGTQFDEEVVRSFIRLIGIYPPGHIVELTNGEAGIILSCQQNNKLRPKVIIVRNAEKKLCRERVLDLSLDQKDKEGKPLRVKEVFTDGKFGIHLQEYKDKGLRFDLSIK
ncbi:MAG: HD-GYP domain-containing protein (c-di-GMP phosphodiesterase class II) [Oleiphilaceae bacterium]|jgi:HD-GYP domain-containing protein (c-di-GMP phosphodiesterase class II)